jgi:hypothetical protein
MRRLTAACFVLAACAGSNAPASDEGPVVPIGVARQDITPDGPIRLTGYGSRTTESEGVEQQLWARALAIGEGKDAVVLVTVDLCGIPATLADEVARRVERRAGVPRERFALCVTHTHSGPVVKGYANLILAEAPPPDQQERIDTYTRTLTDRCERVALDALEQRKPGRLAWGRGEVGFAANRRVLQNGRWSGFGVTPRGPVDHSLPVLRATDPDGKTLAVVVGYACHCTTLGGEFNKICGDWAGYAVEAIERDMPGATALVVIGCAADANPEPRGLLEQAKDHGVAVAREVARVLGGTLHPLPAVNAARLERIDLPSAPLPDRSAWEAQAGQKGQVGRRARGMLERLDRGETIPTTLPYTIQAWTFGDRLVMVFLAGEVVVDYATRLRQALDVDRLWIVAYANDVPCYIPSRRILAEGGYEADDSMIYYDRPTRFAPEVEDIIVNAVAGLVPDSFAAKRPAGAPAR